MACITPVASDLLPTKLRWRKPKFANSFEPLVLELTPGVLGPSEGFAQAGFPISTALRFDESRHITWKVRIRKEKASGAFQNIRFTDLFQTRHHSSSTYDGSVTEISKDFDSSGIRLDHSQMPRNEPPQVVLLASGKTCFRLCEENTGMVSLDEFLQPLRVLDEATDHLGGDFIVALLEPAMLHASARDRLSASILRLLKKRMSVHLRPISLREHGLPQDRTILTLIASPYCAKLPWDLDKANSELLPAQNTVVTMQDVIGDLAFENSRIPTRTRTGLVCRSLHQLGGGYIVYNHYTGQGLAAGQETIMVDENTVLPNLDGRRTWIHSGM